MAKTQYSNRLIGGLCRVTCFVGRYISAYKAPSKSTQIDIQQLSLHFCPRLHISSKMRFISLLPFLSLSRPALAKLGFAAQLFQLQGDSAVTNAKLEWATVAKASSYRVERSSNGGSFSVIATVPGNTHDDYDLKVGQSYRYRVVAIDGSSTVDQSSLATLSPFTPSGTYSSFDNVPDENTASVAETSSDASTVKGNVKEYRYQYQTFSNRSFSHFTEQVSENG